MLACLNAVREIQSPLQNQDVIYKRDKAMNQLYFCMIVLQNQDHLFGDIAFRKTCNVLGALKVLVYEKLY